MEEILVRISELPGADPLSGNELVPMVQDGTTKTRSVSSIVLDGGLQDHIDAVDPHPQYTTEQEASDAAPVQSVDGRTGTVILNDLYEQKRQNNLNATTDPTVNDDSSEGYETLSRWVNTVSGEFYVCVDPTNGSANWQKATLTLDELGSAALANVGAGNGLDADLLDGEHGSYYRAWANITGKPSPVITVDGDATGSVTLNELANGTLTLSIVDDSHNHIISNVDGLQAELDSKVNQTDFDNQKTREQLLKEATLNLDFANNTYEVYEGPVDSLTARPFNDVIDFTRNSVATAITATGDLAEVAVDEQRLVGNREGLLIEGERTNIWLSSENLASTDWTKENVSIESDALIFPQGLSNADKIVEDTTYGRHRVVPNPPPSGSIGKWVQTIYLKPAGRTSVNFIRLNTSLPDGSSVDIENGSVISTGDLSTTIEILENGWVKISLLFESTEVGAVGYVPEMRDENGNGSYIGDGVSGMYLGNVQLEQGSFPTSYIKTEGTTEVREVENCLRVLDKEFNPEEGTVYSEYFVVRSGVDVSNNFNNGAALFQNTSNRLGTFHALTSIRLYTGTSFTDYPFSSNIGDKIRVAYSYFGQQCTLCVNGVLLGQLTGNYNANEFTSFSISSVGGSPAPAKGINRLYIPHAVSSTELQALTSGE